VCVCVCMCVYMCVCGVGGCACACARSHLIIDSSKMIKVNIVRPSSLFFFRRVDGWMDDIRDDDDLS